MGILDLFRRSPRPPVEPPPSVRQLREQLADVADGLEHLCQRFERHLRREAGMMSRGRAAESSQETPGAPNGTEDTPTPVPPVIARRRALRGF